MDEKMKTVGRKMGIAMGITMSFFLSLIGITSAGKFTVPGFLISFLVSSALAVVIGLFLPIGKITGAVLKSAGLERNSTAGHLLSALISDCIYTPIMTLVMVFLAWRSATAQGAQIPFGAMFLKSFGIAMIAGFVLSYFFEPFYMNLFMKDAQGQKR